MPDGLFEGKFPPRNSEMAKNGKLMPRNPWISPQASPEVSSLEPVLKKLRFVHRQYARTPIEPEDCSVWHTERPHVGLFAAAVWLSRGAALEEYGARKKKGTGRADLYVNFQGIAYGCEAKRIVVDIAKGVDSAVVNIRQRLRSERRDAAACCKADCKSHKPLGLCFVAPRIRKTTSDEALTPQRLRELGKALREASECVALVWVAAPNTERLPIKVKGTIPEFSLRSVRKATDAATDALSKPICLKSEINSIWIIIGAVTHIT
jgi:hypothetical protein